MNKFTMTMVAAALVSGFAGALEVQTYTANEAGFAVNSHLILGKKEAILVDAQFTRSEAHQVEKLIRQSGRNLSTIFITHGHPDHYFGLEVLLQAFPNARAVATQEVLKDIEATAAEKLAYWKPIYKTEMPDHVVLPGVTNAKELLLEGETIQILNIGPGESEHLSMLFIPTSGQLFTGDLAYDEVHLWLAEDRPQAWLKNLNAVKALKLSAVYPGHGIGHGVSILEQNRRYIETFVALTQPPTTKAKALQALEKQFPKYRLPVIADLSVSARVH